MGQILRFIHPDANFDPDTLAVLGTAYDKAMSSTIGTARNRQRGYSETYHYAGREGRAQSRPLVRGCTGPVRRIAFNFTDVDGKPAG